MSEQNQQAERPTEVMDKAQAKALEAAEKDGGGSIAAFADMARFDAAQRMARALSSSSLVPQAYQGDVANCLVAMELASRTDASVFMVMQNLDVIRGRPSWRAQFLIAAVNATGRFTPLRYEWQGTEGSDDWGCRAVATDKESGNELRGPLVTIAIAKEEGWYSRKGSKWKTLPELMLTYRAGAWWSRIYCPEIALGMHTVDEARDMEEPDTSGIVQEKTEQRMEAMRQELEEARKGSAPEQPPEDDDEPPTIDAEPEDAPEGREGPDHEIVSDDEDDEPSDYELAKKAYHAACKRASIAGEERLDWQEKHIGERSGAKWSTDDYRKATKMLETGIGLDEEVETVSTEEPPEEHVEEATEKAAQGDMPW